MNAEESPHDLNLLAAHLEDRLDGAEKERLTRHLAGCAECRETLATLARGADLLPLPANAAPEAQPGWHLSVVWLPLAATLVVAVATLTRFGWWTPRDEAPPAAIASASPRPPRASSTLAPPSTTQMPASGTTRPVAPSTPAASRTDTAPADERLLVLRGAQRRVAGKTFRHVFGEWIDADYDSAALLPEVGVSSAEERSALLARIPALAPYAALGERVRVIYEGTVYRFGLEPSP
jgi:hypothetical protein